MADELKMRYSTNYENGSLKDKYSSRELSIDQAAAGMYNATVEIGTSEEAVSLGEISTEGWLRLVNLDDTNYVTYGPDSTGMVAFGRIEAGEHALLRLEPGITIKAQANTAAVQLQVTAWED